MKWERPKPGYSAKSAATGDVRPNQWRKVGVQYCLSSALQSADGSGSGSGSDGSGSGSGSGSGGSGHWNTSRASSVVDGLYQRARIDLVKAHKDATGGGAQANPTLTFSHFVGLLEALAVQVRPDLSPFEALTDMVNCPQVVKLIDLS